MNTKLFSATIFFNICYMLSLCSSIQGAPSSLTCVARPTCITTTPCPIMPLTRPVSRCRPCCVTCVCAQPRPLCCPKAQPVSCEGPRPLCVPSPRVRCCRSRIRYNPRPVRCCPKPIYYTPPSPVCTAPTAILPKTHPTNCVIEPLATCIPPRCPAKCVYLTCAPPRAKVSPEPLMITYKTSAPLEQPHGPARPIGIRSSIATTGAEEKTRPDENLERAIDQDITIATIQSQLA